MAEGRCCLYSTPRRLAPRGGCDDGWLGRENHRSYAVPLRSDGGALPKRSGKILTVSTSRASRENASQLLHSPTPRCGNPEVKPHARAFHWVCYACAPRNNYRFSVLVGTIFKNSNVDLRQWFRVIHLILTSKKEISALQVHRYMDFGSYATAWYDGLACFSDAWPCPDLSNYETSLVWLSPPVKF